MSRSEDLPVAVGELLDGKYLVEKVIGRGGMGVVYEARHVQLDRLFAVKVMRPSMSKSDDSVIRFDREARAAAALKSDHVAHVLEVGRSEAGDPYIVMEHLVGTTLKERVVRKGKLPVAEVARIALDVIDALSEAHALGIVHRDLKPVNVFLVDQRGREVAKVLDFGIAKVTTPYGEDSLTETGSLLGTPEYMAPEQLDTKRGVTPKADVWALGVTMYYALTQKVPFEADTLYELSIQVYAHEPTSVTKYRPDLPQAMVEIIQGCLQKDAKKRLDLAQVRAKLLPLAGQAAPLSPVIASDENKTALYVAPPVVPATLPSSGRNDAVPPVTPSSARSGAVLPVPPSSARGALPLAPISAPMMESSAPFVAPLPMAPAPRGLAVPLPVAVLVAATVGAIVAIFLVLRRPGPEAERPAPSGARPEIAVVAPPAPLPAPLPAAAPPPPASEPTSASTEIEPAPPPEPTVPASGGTGRPGPRPSPHPAPVPAPRKPPKPGPNNGALTHER